MKPALSANTLVMRHSLKVHEALNPDLYNALVGLPKDIRAEFIMQVLRDWSRGILTPMPDGWTITADSATAPPTAATTPSLGIENKPTRSSTVAQAQTKGGEVPGTGGLEALGFRSMADVGDAFDYTTPRP
jgi:hypothetical protein